VGEEAQLRAAIAGAGFIGSVHARSARLAGARLVGVAASSPASSAKAAAALHADRAFDSAEELVASDDVDVVHICTPNNLHAPLAEAALAAGKHVICEKPIAVDLAEALRLQSAAAETGLIAAVPFVYRYYPTAREARERVRAGETGPLRLLHGTYLQDWLLYENDDNWRVDESLGGASRAFADIGAHWCDLAEFISGHRITRLSARTTSAHERTTEDAVVLSFETDRGALGSVVVSQISAGRKNRLWIELDGASESLAFNQEEPETLWRGRREEATVFFRDPTLLSDGAARYTTLPGGHPEGYAHCFDSFVAEVYASIAAGEPADGMPQLADGVRAAQLTEAVLASAADASWVEARAEAGVAAT
jgi:predicted dehydrogenase